MENIGTGQEKKPLLLINILSVAVPLAVVGMLAIPYKLDLGSWTKALAHVIGVINTLTTILLVFGLILIWQNKIELHRRVMTGAFTLGAFFLVCYVIYHLTNPPNRFTGTGLARGIYLFVLFSHIALSMVVLPLVLRAMFFAVTGQFSRHKSIVRYAYPIWLYVSATGVIAYFMLYHLYRAG
jgi:putative membrane protein